MNVKRKTNNSLKSGAVMSQYPQKRDIQCQKRDIQCQKRDIQCQKRDIQCQSKKRSNKKKLNNFSVIVY
jgi:hypothetical protein